MTEKELYRQKRQAQLDEWVAELDKLKAKASGASADTQLELKKEVTKLETMVEEGKSRLNTLAKSGEESWEKLKDGVDTTWKDMKEAFNQAV